jgi:hypothetical protein
MLYPHVVFLVCFCYTHVKKKKKKKQNSFLSPHAPGYLELNRNKTQHQEHQTTQTHEGVANGGRESTTLEQRSCEWSKKEYGAGTEEKRARRQNGGAASDVLGIP